MSGTALKAPDVCTHPACNELHRKIHATPLLYADLQVQWIFDTLAKAIHQGVLIINEETEEGPF